MTLRGTTAPAPVVGALVLGNVADPPLRLPGGTCVSFVDPTSLAISCLFPSIAPTWSWTLPLPNAPVLRSVTVAAQVWYGPSVNPTGFEVSNGVDLTLGY